ncbi:4Fe-4S binding protein [Thermodesulforhabdus norvegica]|uniref:Polyferredoxin n=1 Tax=Thermodesulforhabdus norvegica TaxID=39841 RepID=A0A1I4QQJ6_9BACT|nr:4Fe-4S binding protein [Thermodesulforhabdus norvegica]SFM42301.1 Polyferredoxin [Thermodesulforhabdus norvegica]
MKPAHWIWLRRVSQGIFFVLFLWFLLINAERVGYDVIEEGTESLSAPSAGPIRFFFLVNPLTALSLLLGGNLPGKGFLWSLLVVALTLVAGRFFCGFFCPLGTVHHVASQGVMSQVRALRYRRIKYAVLLALIISSVAGLNMAGVIDPISLIYRSFALLILPALFLGLQKISEFMGGLGINFFYEISGHMEAWAMELSGWKLRFYQVSWLTGLLFIGIVALNRVYPRFWCRILCPLGALFALLVRFSLLTIKRREKRCTHCGICMKYCPGNADPEPGVDWRKSECLLCLRCMSKCPEGVISFSFASKQGHEGDTGITRRVFLTGAIAGLSLPLMERVKGRGVVIPRDRLIRPPGSLPEEEFLKTCYRCGICMKRCPTNAIQPALGEAGVAGLWTPVLVMAFGYCEHTCTACGALCPTGAIRPLTVEEKIGKPIRIGSAYIDRSLCLPWSQNIPCIVCEEHCPTSPKAIYFETKRLKRKDGSVVDLQLPCVDLARCTGCGICENKCPVKSKPAIRITSSGESRSGIPLLLR